MVFCMRLLVDNWIPQFGVAVVKNNKVCGFVESCFNTEKALLTSKLNSFVLFLELYLLVRLSHTSGNIFAKNKNKKICDFCHFLVWYLAGVSDDLYRAGAIWFVRACSTLVRSYKKGFVWICYEYMYFDTKMQQYSTIKSSLFPAI